MHFNTACKPTDVVVGVCVCVSQCLRANIKQYINWTQKISLGHRLAGLAIVLLFQYQPTTHHIQSSGNVIRFYFILPRNNMRAERLPLPPLQMVSHFQGVVNGNENHTTFSNVSFPVVHVFVCFHIF